MFLAISTSGGFNQRDYTDHFEQVLKETAKVFDCHLFFSFFKIVITIFLYIFEMLSFLQAVLYILAELIIPIRLSREV